MEKWLFLLFHTSLVPRLAHLSVIGCSQDKSVGMVYFTHFHLALNNQLLPVNPLLMCPMFPGVLPLFLIDQPQLAKGQPSPLVTFS